MTSPSPTSSADLTADYARAGFGGVIAFGQRPALIVVDVVLRCFVKGSPLGEFPAALTPQSSDTVVMKQYASAFFGSSLASTLTAMKIDTVLVTGFTTSGCVRATALDAMQHGFNVFVVREACGDRDAAPHASNLFDLQAKYAEVIAESRAHGELRAIKASMQ